MPRMGVCCLRAMRSNDFHDDCQAKSSTLTSRALKAPKPVEDVWSIYQTYAGPLSGTVSVPSPLTSTITSVPGPVCASAFSIRLRSTSTMVSRCRYF